MDLIIRDRILLDGYSKAKKPENYLSRIKWHYQPEWFTEHAASWNTHYKPVFTESLTKRGYGFTFNILPEKKMFTEE
jgi:hypothetical protein